MFDYYDRYGLVGNDKVLRMILGREPADFAEAARQASPFRRLVQTAANEVTQKQRDSDRNNSKDDVDVHAAIRTFVDTTSFERRRAI